MEEALKRYWTAFDTLYNRRPGELYGMGTESMSIYGNGNASLEEFIDTLAKNSILKHEDYNQYIYGTSIPIPRPDWINWVGQPLFHITNIRYQENKGEEKNPFMVASEKNV